MTAWVLGLAAAWAVVRMCRIDRTWPWRVAELEPVRRGVHRGPRLLSGRRRRSTRPRPSHRPRGRGRRGRDRGRERAVEADLVTAIDLLQVASSAGHTLHTGVAEVGRVGTGPVCAGLAEVDGAFARGRPLADALGDLPDRLGPPVRPLVTTLTASLRSGAPPGPSLQRLGDAQRQRQRRRAEERVRRLPVLLLAPLVGLVMPAFVVLTIVPVAVTTARAGLVPASARGPVQPVPVEPP